MSSLEENAPLAPLAPLVGEWAIEAQIGGQTLTGANASIDWLEDGAFLVQSADAELPPDTPAEFAANSPFPTLSLIGLDDASGSYSVLYADGRGVHRVYDMSFEDRVWRQWREAPGFHQRSEAIVSEDGETIAGRWEKSSDGTEWELDFEYTYRRVG